MTKEIVGFPVCVEQSDKKWVARGINSEVWRVDDYALKVYKNPTTNEPSLTREQLEFYGEVTAAAAELAEKDNLKIKLPFPLGEQKLRVNRYLSIKKCDCCGQLEAVVPFIEGANLLKSTYMLVLGDWQNHFGQVNYFFETKLGVDGIFISPVNVKNIRSSGLMITDLADDVTWVQKRY